MAFSAERAYIQAVLPYRMALVPPVDADELALIHRLNRLRVSDRRINAGIKAGLVLSLALAGLAFQAIITLMCFGALFWAW